MLHDEEHRQPLEVDHRLRRKPILGALMSESQIAAMIVICVFLPVNRLAA
jgi:hypothetical protein